MTGISDRTKKLYASLDDNGKRGLLAKLKIRAEVRRVKFNKSRSPKDGDSYAKTRAELGWVRTQMSIEKLL
jgi:hypothetical protein